VSGSVAGKGTVWFVRLSITLGSFVALYLALSCISLGVRIPGRGGIGIMLGSLYVQSGAFEYIPNKPAFFHVHRPHASFGWMPKRFLFPGTTFLFIPLWIPALGVFVSIVLLQIVCCSIKRRRAGGLPRCSRCGYLTIGLPEPRCPECGAPFAPAKSAGRSRPVSQ